MKCYGIFWYYDMLWYVVIYYDIFWYIIIYIMTYYDISRASLDPNPWNMSPQSQFFAVQLSCFFWGEDIPITQGHQLS